MYRSGHFGMSLLMVSVVTLPLHPTLALPLSVIMIATEPLPDYDMKIGFIEHRGYSHTLLAAIVVGAVLSGIAVGIQTIIKQQANAAPEGIGVEAIIGFIPPAQPLALLVFLGTLLGFIAHFIADMITVGTGYHGIQPLAPISQWESPLQLCNADDASWNGGLLGIGMVAVAVSGYVQYSILTGGI